MKAPVLVTLHANPAKSSIVVKEEHEDEAVHVFEGLNLNITSNGIPLYY